jgi:hypothetical protein
MTRSPSFEEAIYRMVIARQYGRGGNISFLLVARWCIAHLDLRHCLSKMLGSAAALKYADDLVSCLPRSYDDE